MNIFSEFFYSLWNFDTYKRFIKNKWSKVFIYGFSVNLLIVCITLVSVYFGAFKPVNEYIESKGGIENIIQNDIPYFEVNNGVLYLEQPYYYEDENIYLNIDTNMVIDENTVNDDKVKGKNVVLIDSTSIFVKNENGVREMKLADIIHNEGRNFTKNDFVAIVPEIEAYIYGYAVGGLVISIILSLFIYFGETVVYVIIGAIISLITRCRLKAGEIYKLATYAKTMPRVLAAVFGISYVINFGDAVNIPVIIITAVYMFIAMRKIKIYRDEEERIYNELNSGNYGDAGAAFSPVNMAESIEEKITESSEPVKSYAQINAELKAAKEINNAVNNDITE
ncbi:MAG: DUF1189 domain-containing protein [Firmicutes bacterium]|nr:DUF1189 domain-containing protein [Bacillota bacterium]